MSPTLLISTRDREGKRSRLSVHPFRRHVSVSIVRISVGAWRGEGLIVKYYTYHHKICNYRLFFTLLRVM